MIQLLSPERVAIASTEPDQHLEDKVDLIATLNPATEDSNEAQSAPQDQDLPQSNTITPETLKKFRRGYGEHAIQATQRLKGIAVTSAEGILRKARLLLDMKLSLNRKEWGVWLREVLGWFGSEATQYLQIAKAFKDFEPSVFSALEPFTILKLRTKRYAPVVARLREELAITSQLIKNFIKEVIPKQSRRKKAVPNYGEAVLKQRVNAKDGTSYFSLNANLSDKPGSWLESKLKDRTVGQVLEQAAAWEQQSEERRHDLREGLEAEVEQQARSRFEMLEFGLKQKIAHLEAQLAVVKPSELVSSPTATRPQSVQAPEESTANTGLHSARIEPIDTTGFQPSFDNEVALAPDDLDEALDLQVAEFTSAQASEQECDPAITTNCLEPVAPITYSQPSDLSAAACQPIATPWEQIKQTRDAESYVQLLDSQIQELNSKLAKPSLDRIVERELKDVLKNRQNLRTTKISQIVNLADSNGISANYEQLKSNGRVVLAPEYASEALKQAKSWSDVVLVVACDRAQLRNAVSGWSMESKQLLVQLLSEHLETESNAFDQIDWIPEKLLNKALSALSFTLEKIRSSNNLVDEPEIEQIRGCKFKSVSNFGNLQEQWFFQAGDKVLDVFGRSGFAVEKF